jgi:hypothetical protein
MVQSEPRRKTQQARAKARTNRKTDGTQRAGRPMSGAARTSVPSSPPSGDIVSDVSVYDDAAALATGDGGSTIYHHSDTLDLEADGNGPDVITVGCTSVYKTCGVRRAWLVSVGVNPHESSVDKSDPWQWDEELEQVLPESAWWITPAKAREIAALFNKVADDCELLAATDWDEEAGGE